MRHRSTTSRLRARVRALQEMGDDAVSFDWYQLTDDALWWEYGWVALLNTGMFKPFYRDSVLCGSCGVAAPSGVVSRDSFTCAACVREAGSVMWMDNTVGYQCQRCDQVFGPRDYGWPPDCCAVKESIHLHLIEASP
jgi:hypothetical protein